MSMFCYQCQETAKGTGCEHRNVYGLIINNIFISTSNGIDSFH